MSRLISELLGVNQALFADDIRRLEHASGHHSVDVRLTADLLTLTRQKTRELGLDPRDTTGRELYYALLNLVRLHDSFVAKKLGVADASDVHALLPRIRDAVLQAKIPHTAWVLKASSAKRLLKLQPPKALMRYLGYKSLESMLKREPIGEIFGGLKLIEKDQWYRKFIAQYHQLMPMDFETRPIEIRLLDKTKWQKAANTYTSSRHHNLLDIRELGVVLMLPLPLDKRPGVAITLLPLLLYEVNEIRLFSSFYKLHQMQPDFGERIAASLQYDRGTHVQIAGQEIHWRVVQRHFGRKGQQHPSVLEPHVTHQDLAWRNVEEVLYHLEPALHFWHGMDYVATKGDHKPVSFNLLDMALNYLNGLDYGHRVYQHAQDGLWNELFVRYMGQPALENQVLKSLDYETVDPEILEFAGETF